MYLFMLSDLVSVLQNFTQNNLTYYYTYYNLSGPLRGGQLGLLSRPVVVFCFVFFFLVVFEIMIKNTPTLT